MQVQRGLFPKISDPPKYPEKILFCGWRRDIDDMIMVIDYDYLFFVLFWIYHDVPLAINM